MSCVLSGRSVSLCPYPPDPTAAEHPEEVDPGVWGRDREDETDAGTPQHQLLQTPPNIRWAASGKISQSGICGIKKFYNFKKPFFLKLYQVLNIYWL